MITVYSKPSCGQCFFTKRYLDELGVTYKEVDVLEDAKALDYIKSLGFESLPVITAEGHEPHSGFRPDRLAKMVNRDGEY